MPSAVVSPIFAGCVAAVYVGTGAGHFDPGRGAMVFVVGGNPEPPLDREDLRAYREAVEARAGWRLSGPARRKRRQGLGKTAVAARIRSTPKAARFFEMHVGDDLMQFGASPSNVLNGHAPPQLVRQLLEARLQSELSGRSARAFTENEVVRDWNLLSEDDGGWQRLALAADLPSAPKSSRDIQPTLEYAFLNSS